MKVYLPRKSTLALLALFATASALSVAGPLSWVSTDPWQRGASEAVHAHDEVRPAISSRTLTIRGETAAMAYEAEQHSAP
jgi:hypothetical protein